MSLNPYYLVAEVYQACKISISVVTLGAFSIWLIVYGLNYFQHPLAQRMLAPLPTTIFLLGSIAVQVSQCLSSYLRAHKREPFMYLSIGTGLTTGFLVWILGSKYGPIGAGVSYFLTLLVSLPFGFFIWRRCCYEWHKE